MPLGGYSKKDNSFKNYITGSLRQLDTIRYLTTICSKILFLRNIPQDNIAIMLKITSESQTGTLKPSPQEGALMAIILQMGARDYVKVHCSR